MDDQLSKLLEDFCKIRGSFNTSNVTAKTVSIITRFVKAVQLAEKIAANPPKKERNFDPLYHLKTNIYTPLKEKELKERVEKEWANPVKKVTEEVKVPKKRGPKPKKT